MKRWELVQVLQPRSDALYHLVVKTVKTVVSQSRTGTALSSGGRSLDIVRRCSRVTQDPPSLALSVGRNWWL